MIIGAGGVGRVVAHKCAQAPEVFSEIFLASRTEGKCRKIASELGTEIQTARVDADNVSELTTLLDSVRPFLVINVALPYQDLAIMDACLAAGVHYLDTANYEPRETAKFEYHWQWDYHDRFADAGLTALLGSGFDPGVTNVFTAYLAKHHFDEIRELDIIDVNAGDHGLPFATNFNPEINLREVTAECRHWENGQFVSSPPLSGKARFTCPDDIGSFDVYGMYHEELESLTRHFPTLDRARFWMSFSDQYLKFLDVLQKVGMTSIEPVSYNGTEIIPLKFLEALLPDPATLGASTTGKVCIGCVVKGLRDGQEKVHYIYTTCDHEAAYAEVGAQAVSYTTGVPAMIGAKMLIGDRWRKPGVWNVEQFDPDPFLDELGKYGLDWRVTELDDFSLGS